MEKIKKFFLNGQLYYSEQSLTIYNIISYFNCNGSLLVLEYNSIICPKKKWKDIFVSDQDKIEIVTIVGGG